MCDVTWQIITEYTSPDGADIETNQECDFHCDQQSGSENNRLNEF